MSQIKNSVESLSNRFDQIEDRISSLENMVSVWEHANELRKEAKRFECKIQDFWGIIKSSSLWIVGIEEGEEM
jgi:uncharacterized coiled-coil DUF342 family protein